MPGIRKTFGKHFLVELIGCDPDRLRYVPTVKKIFLSAACASKARIISHDFHQFYPWGVTGIIFIQESHFSIHTWPEDRYAAFDIFTCGKMNPEKAIQAMKIGLGASKIRQRIVARGF